MENKETELTKEQEEALIKAMEEAKMPILMTDKDFTLGERELDIRKLSKANKDQMMFRMCCHAITYTRAMQQDLIDIMKLLMLVLKKMGVDNIIEATDKLEDELMEDLKGANQKKN